MSEAVLSDISVTFVHGTWGRGIFPPKNDPRKGRWFDPDSRFRDALRLELRKKGIEPEFNELHWSGKNSIFEREKAAQSLSRILSQEDSSRAKIVIAHSHGGNVALRMLSKISPEHLPIHVVALATPFLEVRPLKLWLSGLVLRSTFYFGLLYVFLTGYYGLRPMFAARLPYWFGVIEFAYGFLAVPLFYVYEVAVRKKRPARVQHLSDSTSLETASTYGSSILVVRAIDDEASLLIAFGAVLNRFARSVTNVWWIVGVFAAMSLIVGILVGLLADHFSVEIPFGMEFMQIITRLLPWSLAASIFLAAALCLARGVYGSEMVFAPLECQVNTQSAPDAMNLSKLVTLSAVQGEFRHMIYDHPNCAEVIADWIAVKAA